METPAVHVFSRYASRGRCCTALGALRRAGVLSGSSQHWAGRVRSVHTWAVKEVLTQKLRRSLKVPEWTSEELDKNPSEASWELCI